MKSFRLKFNSYQKSIELRLKQLQTNRSPRSMHEPINYILSGGGKRIRPVLTLLAAEAVGGNFKSTIYAAVAIEILHNFTLVHDDIMDNATSRRGRKTIHTKWDSNVAILSGDAMIAFAYNELLRTKSKNISEAISILTNGLFEVCEGQAYDKEFETQKNVSIKEYLKMIDKKTAKMFSVAMEIGAVVGGGTQKEISALKSFGMLLGRAFQIQDDLLDVIADEKEFGKKIGGDIKEGKRTFLFLHALAKSNPNQKLLLQKVMLKKCKSTKEVENICKLYKTLGVIEIAKKAIKSNIFEAQKKLESLKNNESKKMFFWFANKIGERNN